VIEEEDVLASEEPMEIRLVTTMEGAQKSRSLSVTMRTPGNDFELAAGFLFTEGIIGGRDDIEKIVYCTDPGVEQEYNIVSVHLRPHVRFDPALVERNFYTTSSCGVCGKASI
jgi:FdhD protein